MTAGGAAPAGWRGQFMDGLSAAVVEVRLALVAEALVGQAAAGETTTEGATTEGAATEGATTEGALGGGAAAGGALFRWPAGALRIEPLGDGRVAITCAAAPDAVLTTPAADAALYLPLPGALRPRRSRARAALLYGGGALTLAALVYFNLDPVARAVARRVPPAYEAQMGAGLAQLLERQYCETPAAAAALGKLAARLGAVPPPAMHIMDTDVVNAFTFPGGVVIVTRGLLAEAEGPDELAGVLAHELEHVSQRHVMVHVVRSGILTAAWQATVGDYAGLFVVDPKTALDIASLRFSRDDEREADRGALARLDAGGIARAPFRRFFERMRGKTDAVPPWLSNHPASAERISSIADDVGALPRTPALPPADWKAIKDGCKSAAR